MIRPGVIEVTGAMPQPQKALARKLKPAKTMTVADAQRAIRAAGMTTIKASKLKACAEVGDYITQLGVLPYGRACVAVNTEHLRLALEECVRLRTEKSSDPDYRLNLLNVQEHLSSRLTEAGEVLIKSASIDTQSGFNKPSENRSFLPGQAVFPVITKEMHVNVGGKTPPTNET